MKESKSEPIRALGLTDTTMLVVGTVIGTGVFMKTSVMMQQVETNFVTAFLCCRAAVNASRSSVMYRWIALVGRTIIPPVWLVLRITASAMPRPR